jgi:hypothetical protein
MTCVSQCFKSPHQGHLLKQYFLQLRFASHSAVDSSAAMFLTRSEYDRGVNTFSPEGRLFQVEYAIEAIKLGSTAVGIQVKDGVVIAVEKRLTSTLLVPSSVEKIMEVVRRAKISLLLCCLDAASFVPPPPPGICLASILI